jgi:hypothetical protein
VYYLSAYNILCGNGAEWTRLLAKWVRLDRLWMKRGDALAA